ncbi:MAG: hypothetical protein LBQ56_07945, partial [Synergistaceae bacterium]|nr:hypothetical protein [Synergistaceae bacterium]
LAESSETGARHSSVGGAGVMLGRWADAGLASSAIIGGRRLWFCDRLMRETATREAMSDGELDGFRRAAYRVHSGMSETTASYYGEARMAYYAGDRVLGANRPPGPETDESREILGAMYGGRPAPPEVEILCNPIDERILLGLPSESGADVFGIAIKFLKSGEDALMLRRIFRKFAEAHGRLPGVARLRCLDALLSGDIIEAGRQMEFLETTPETSDVCCMRGALRLMQGDPDMALSCYEAGTRMLRAEGASVYGPWPGVFYPLLMLRRDIVTEGEASQRTMKIFDSYTREASLPSSDAEIKGSYRMIRRMASCEPEDELFSADAASYIERPADEADALFFMLAALRENPGRAAEFILPAKDACRRMVGLEMGCFASQMASVIRSLGDGEEFSGVPEPGYALKDLFGAGSDWKKSLSMLAGIGESEEGGRTRLSWEISWTSREDGDPESIKIRPIEQTLSARGTWSRGRPVAMRRLMETPGTSMRISDCDRRAIEAIREGPGAEYAIDAPKLLRTLAGHPNLVRGGEGGAVEIVSDDIRISARLVTDALSGAESYLLRMEPFPCDADMGRGFVIKEEARNRLKIVPLDERHCKMARIIGPRGLEAPGAARDAVLGALGSLASIVTVHSDIDDADAGPESIPPDTNLYVQLQPHGGGLDVEAVSRPLGHGGPACPPGAGGPNMFGLANGRRVQTQRDLTAESGSLFFLENSCPALSGGDRVRPNRWHIADPEASLEFLLQLGGVTRDVVVEWPKGGALTVRSVPPSMLSMSVHNSREWFAATGSIRVDDDAVMSFCDLARLIRASSSRFVPIGDGKFAAITGEFRRRIEDLASVGEERGDGIRIPQIAAPLLAPLAELAGSFEGSPEWRDRAALVDESSLLTPEVPPSLRGELREYQTEGYRWMMRLAHWGAGACLADDMGLGKTVQALAALLARGPGGPALVVAPTSVVANWLEEAAKFAPSLNVSEIPSADREDAVKKLAAMDVLAVSYGLLQSEAELLSSVEWRTIVLDEAQAIKNSSAKRSVAAMKLRGDFRVITTGTPIENNLSELWNLFRFANPGLLGSADSFAARFMIPIERDGSSGARNRLKRIISPFILRRTKESVLTE